MKTDKAIRFVRGFYPAAWDDAYCQQLLERFKLNPNDKIATLSFGSRWSSRRRVARNC